MKKTISDLAFYGGPPAFEDTLHVGRPNLGDRDQLLARFNELLDRRWLTNNGPFVREFERQVAELVGVKHCIAMSNGTVALEIAARALGFADEVIVPSFTFIATAHCLQWQGITPIFCDIDPETHSIDPDKIERLITPKTTGIMGVHLWGRPCAIERLQAIADKHNLKLLFDASHAFNCSYKGRMVGTFGEAEVFSFHATKFINALEGGAVVTNSDELSAKIRLMKNFGFAGLDEVKYIGTNGKMNEASAAMGLTSLESLDNIVAANRRNHEAYKRGLAGIAGLKLHSFDEGERQNYQYIVLEIDEAGFGIGRDLLMQVLHAENVRARRYFYPGCHRMEPYRSYFPNADLLLPETVKVSERVLCLPTGTAVNPHMIEEICQTIKVVSTSAAMLKASLLRELSPLKESSES